MFVKKIKIGNVELKNNIFLAPMAGITDRAFRIVCEKFEPGLVYTEMISSKGLFHNDSKTKLLLNMEDERRPIAVQIFGSDVESMKYAAEYVFWSRSQCCARYCRSSARNYSRFCG